MPADDPRPSNAPSRRRFLKMSAAAVGGAAAPLAGSTAANAQAQEPPLLPVPDRPGFDHLVALMFENRSFDNLLGYLYPPDRCPRETYDGVANHPYANPGPDGAPIPAYVYRGDTDAIMASPKPDPGEYTRTSTHSSSARSIPHRTRT